MDRGTSVSSGMEAIAKLNLSNKESIVDLLMEVQVGNISCRRGASEIMAKCAHDPLVRGNHPYCDTCKNRSNWQPKACVKCGDVEFENRIQDVENSL